MTAADKRWWETQRLLGRGWFILWEGILNQGAWAGFWLALLAVLCGLVDSDGTLSGSELTIGFATLWIIIAIPVGWLVGTVLWNRHEQDYRRFVAADPKR